MSDPQTETLFYKRSNFVAHLPSGYLYTPSHTWLEDRGNSVWRMGLTKFATRMLGEMVDHGFQVEPGAQVEPGQVVGFLEGFKAISDIFCVAKGTFLGGNPALQERIELVTREPFHAGWLYEVQGTPDPACLNVEAYRDLLDRTIDRLLQNQKEHEV